MENKENLYESYEEKLEANVDSAVLYERSRIKALAEQREVIQKKTFTKWINAHLLKTKDTVLVDDLYTDLQDGKILLQLLETISGEKLPKPSKGKMRIHCLENVGKSLKFLNDQHVYLENLGAHDIVDANQTLTLGLIWTLILRFQIQYAIPDETDGSRTAKEALLLWTQMKTADYKNISIRNFTNSWKDGLAFNAILHKHNPDIVDFVKMTKADPIENMNMAFDIAEREYGVPQLLDANDIAVEQPDERSIMTYVGLLSSTLNKLKDNNVKCKRLCNVINEAICIEKMIKEYEDGSEDLLNWIHSKINWMDKEEMRESLPEVKEQLNEFTSYRLDEKPPKFDECGVLEMNFFEFQSKLRNDNRKWYIPPEGKLISDINRSWEDLEKAEHRMEIKLHDELIRQEKLDQLANRFNRKAQMRETWLHENDRLVHQSIFGDNLVTVDAAIKKHEALEGDIFAHEVRITSLGMIVDELDRENYYKVDETKTRYDEIMDLWDKLLEDLKQRREKLDKCREIQVVLQEGDYLLDWIGEIGSRLQSKDFGKHLLGVENLLEEHKILSSDIRNLDVRIGDVSQKMNTCEFDTGSIDPANVKIKDDQLQDSYRELIQLTLDRENELSKYKTLWELIEELDNDKEWIKEVTQLMHSPDIGHDLTSVERLIRKHDQITADVNIRTENINKNLHNATSNRDEDNVEERQNLLTREIEEVNELLENLAVLSEERKDNLEESLLFYQLLADIDDNDVMILEERRLFESTDVGDKQSLTEFYLKQFEEQMIQVNVLKKTMDELLSREEDLNKDNLNGNKKAELVESCDKMCRDFEDLIKLTEIRRHLLDNSLTKFHLLNDIDTIDTWIVAKEKFLHTLVPTEEIDELNVIKHRFDCFTDQMKINSEKLSQINDVSVKLIDSEHPESQIISSNQNSINRNWNDLADLTAGKQKELDQSLSYNQFLIECRETCSWIQDKMKLLEWTDDLKDDLDGIMQLQRRLGSLQRDIQAVEAKVTYLNEQAVDLKIVKPEVEQNIEVEITTVNELWAELKIMLQDRDARLNSSNELQKFLQDLDSFNVWLSNKQKEVACQDIPNNLQEAEKLFAQHQQVREEIRCWEPEFARLLQFGRQLSQSKDDSQYLMFNQRLDGLEDGWKMLEEMCNDKDVTLTQSIDAQSFILDSLQVDNILTKQESFLAKEDVPATIEASENNIREFETFKISVASNQPKIDDVLSFGDSLINNNALSDKIRHKCDQIKERCDIIRSKIDKRGDNLKEEYDLKLYLEDVMDLEEWIAEKMMTATDTSYRDAKDISTRYNRFKDFEHELEANEDRVNGVIKAGEELIEKCPRHKVEIKPKIESLKEQWWELMKTATEKCNAMEDANREIIFDETTKSMLSWVSEISNQIITTEETTEEIGLVEINEKMKDQEDKDKQLAHKRKMLNDIADHAVKLKEQYPDRGDEFEEIQKEVRIKLTQVEAPLADRRDKLSQQKKVQQFLRDLQDEKEWIDDKMKFIHNNKLSPETLQVCLQKIRRLKTLATEIDNHEARIDDIKAVCNSMIADNHPSSDKFRSEIKELDEMWKDLLESLKQCQNFFDENREVHEYLTDATESEIWMGDREFDLLKEEKTKDEEGAMKTMRKHDELTSIIHNYASDIGDLDRKAKKIADKELPGWHAVGQRQDKLANMYAGLIDMCLDRRMRIEDLIKLHHLQRSIQDLEEWIAERTLVATSHETGSDFEHCSLLRDRFTEFAIETNEMGGPRVSEAIYLCDNLIEQGHNEAAEIARWKDRVNEAWADLLELIETRIQLLKAVWDFFKFMSESAELLDRIREKMLLIPEVTGKDAKTVAAYQRKHTAFVLEISSLKPHVDTAIETAVQLLHLYSGSKEHELVERRIQLEKLWYNLNKESDNRNNVLLDANDFFRFLAMVRELLLWMTEIEGKMNVDDKARDVCGVELIIANHRSLKAEIDSRDESISICLTLGQSMINRRHPSREEMRKKCAEVASKHFKIKDDWQERQEYLDMLLEVYQFARDAAVAESWLIAQEPQVHTNEIGESLTDTLNLIQKHQGLERTLSTQEDRFEALRKLTILEEKQLALTEEMKSERNEKKINKLAELLRDFRTPPPSPKEISRHNSDTELAVEDAIVSTHYAAVNVAPRDIDTNKREESSKSEQRELSPYLAEEPIGIVISRKHEWETATKKSKDRAWHSLFMHIKEKTMSFYRDERHFNDDNKDTYKREKAFDLDGAVSHVAKSYKKRANVFRLRLKNGCDYLIQTADEPLMNRCVELITKIGGVDPNKASSTLPGLHTELTQDTGTKKKFTTLSRKQK